MRPSCRRLSRAALVAALIATSLAFAKPSQAEEVVAYSGKERSGTIVVRTGERRLYLVIGGGQAIRYTVGVGKPGKQWSGRSRIVRKMLKPAFAPTAQVKRDIPSLPDYIAGGQAQQSARRRGAPAGTWPICDPRHQPSGLGRRFRLLWLHQDV